MGRFTSKVYESISRVNNILIKKPKDIPSIAFFFPENVKLLMTKILIKEDYLFPRTIPLLYDVFSVMITEAGIVRGIRYRGQHNLSPEGYLEINKLELGRLSQRFCPTFITWGSFKKKKARLEVSIATYLLSHIPKLLAATFREGASTIFTALFPSPFTAMGTYFYGRYVLLAPFTSQALLYFSKAYKRYGRILGRNIEYLSLPLSLVLYDGASLHLSAPFRGALPLQILKSDSLLREAHDNNKNILTSIIGLLVCYDVFVASSTLWKEFGCGEGSIIILGYCPMDVRITALFEAGRILSISRRTLKSIDNLPIFLTINRSQLKRLHEEYSRLIIRVRQIEHNIDILELPKKQADLFLNMAKKYGLFIDDENELKILIPPLLSLHTFHGYNVRPLLNILSDSKLSDLERQLELIKLTQSHNSLDLSLILKYKCLLEAWKTALQEQRKLISIGLFQTF